MTDSQPPKVNPVDNDVYDELPLRSLQQLAWAIESSVGQFKLILARCNYAKLRDRLIQRLQEICQVEIQLLVLQPSHKTLYTAIRDKFDENLPACIMVVGLETVPNLAAMLTSANQVREEFRKNFAFPLVLWIDDEIYKQLMQLAPDFESWATTKNFAIAQHDLTNFIQQLAEQYFNNNLNLNLDAYRVLETELAAAQRDLSLELQDASPELKANLFSLLGFVKQVNHKIDIALEHYQVALALFRQINFTVQEIQIIGDIAFCYYLKAFKTPDINHLDWQHTRHYIHEYINLITKNKQLIANSIFKFGVILRDLQEWKHLRNLAEYALKIHQADNQSTELAKDYGFLAEVALAEERFLEANKFAQQAINIVATIVEANSCPPLLNDLSLYRYLLARSQYHLGDYQQAIQNLETAKDIGNPQIDLKLYLNILHHLQKVYFEQKAYLKAYETKQQQRSVEQQFGLRAFIGAGRLQATKQVGATGFAQLRVDNKDSIAPEIAASGRQLDVERLIERIGRPDKKLIVIHGQSGVGKSSLVNAGLVPALKNQAIGIQDNLPVTMRVYTNWVEELGRLLGVEETGGRGDGLTRGWGDGEMGRCEDEAELELQGSTSELGTSTSEPERSHLEPEHSHLEPRSSTSNTQTPNFSLPTPNSSLLTPNSLLIQLRENEQRNLRTVLIFDQFEEFFFVYTEPAQRKQFFEFLGECLNVLSLKVILSLRVDYIHYLLECNDLPSLKIIGNDILSNNVLYKLGNFSPDDAKSIIQRLTENTSFRLEAALVEQLVEDLAAELGEVRPIELQVVGAQLQTENITTLAEYQQRGTKEQLVKRYLDEVVNDCGVENQQMAELLMYLLTDDKGTRPLKTRAELERDLHALSEEADKTKFSPSPHLPISPSNLDLILEIFVESGLVVLLPENPADRYQLVHDYIAAFIRQQQEPKLKHVMAELQKEREQRKQSEVKLNRVLKRALFGSITAGLGFAALAAGTFQWSVEANVSQINAINNSSEAFAISGQYPDAVITALRASSKLKHTLWAQHESETLMQTVFTLQQAVYLKPNEKKENRAIQVNTLEGHSDRVNSVAYSPNGQQLASAGDDNTIKIWDVSSGQLLKTLKGHSDRVFSVAYSPNGQQLASASVDNTIKIWDVSSGKLLKFLKGHSKGVTSVAYSPNGQQLASASVDKTIKIWDVSSGKLLKSLKGHSKGVTSVAYSPNGQQLASASVDNTIKIWDVSSGKLLKFLKGHSDRVNSVAYSPNGQQLASASDDNTIKIWDVSSGQLVKTLPGRDRVNSVAYSPNGQQLASASVDNTIKIWDVSSGQLLKTLPGHSSWVFSVAYSPNGQQLASASDDKTIKIWDVSSGKPLKSLKGHSRGVTSVVYSPNGQQLASASYDNTIKIWDVSSGQLLKTLTGHSSSVFSVAYSPNGQQLASGSDDNTIKIWDVSNGQLLKTLPGSDRVNSVAYSPNGQQLASASFDNTIKIWDVSSGKLLKFLKGHSDRVNSVAYSPNGQQLASASDDKTIKIWDVSSGQLLKTLTGHSSSVFSVAYSPNGQQLASASDDKTIKIWDVSSGQLLKTLTGHSSSVFSVAYSPNGQQLASASYDSTIKIWDVSSGKPLKTLTSHTSWVYSLAYSPNGQQLASASDDKTIILWDLDLDNLLLSGCNLLNNYLIAHPEVLEELQSCQTPSRLAQAATVLVIQGEKLARNDDINNAVKKFNKAQQWDNKLKFDSQARAKEFVNKGKAERLVDEGNNPLQQKKFKEALAAYTAALKFDPKVQIPTSSWHAICWDGSLQKQAADVLPACEKAVAVAPEDGNIRDSRGLARALTGNTQGAIEDFEAYIAQTQNKDSKAQRQRWVKDLRAGKNPFTDAELKKLRN
ncbi:ribosome assembly protein 4 [Nostoc punctiforme FACHB-252]|uniref:Ribosome assembly protein 4 n=1 Tax=Nostoc punctiforme FACHB-252 TaxID=1357509 RepID=A0ABR8H6U5_NOSPU|nr:ribosome assembly protein 4 [Nostoc punctiforme]MBD2610955.1 ribosome assembly protein 4 [Nostoc punctiforme FACHB-252]